MSNRDVSAPFSDHSAPIQDNHNRAEDEPDIEGYDESQRAEIAEVEGHGPTDGILMTNLTPDSGGDIDDDEIEDDADDLDRIVDTD